MEQTSSNHRFTLNQLHLYQASKWLWLCSVLVLHEIVSNYEQDQEMGAVVCYSVIMYVNYDLTAEDGSSYKKEQKMAAINSNENHAQASTHVN